MAMLPTTRILHSQIGAAAQQFSQPSPAASRAPGAAGSFQNTLWGSQGLPASIVQEERGARVTTQIAPLEIVSLVSLCRSRAELFYLLCSPLPASNLSHLFLM